VTKTAVKISQVFTAHSHEFQGNKGYLYSSKSFDQKCSGTMEFIGEQVRKSESFKQSREHSSPHITYIYYDPTKIQCKAEVMLFLTKIFFIKNIPMDGGYEFSCCFFPDLLVLTICHTCIILSSETLQSTHGSFGFQEKSEILAVWPP